MKYNPNQLYQGRKVTNSAIECVMEQIENGVLEVPKKRGPRTIYLIGKKKTKLPCKFTLEEACKLTDSKQALLSPADHIANNAESFLSGRGFKVVR